MVSTILKPLSAPTSAQPRMMTRDTLRVFDLAPTCGSQPVVGRVRTAVVGSDRTGRVGSSRKDECFHVCCVVENKTVSVNKVDHNSRHTIIFVIQHDRLLSVDIVPHCNTY